MNRNDINTLLQKWFDTKREITNLENKAEKYKKAAEKIMNTEGTNILESSYHTLQRKQISRTTISKKYVPKNIWDQYSKRSTYSAYYLTEN